MAISKPTDKDILVNLIAVLPREAHLDLCKLVADDTGVQMEDVLLVRDSAERFIARNIGKGYTAGRNSKLSLWSEAITLVTAVAGGFSWIWICPLVQLLHKLKSQSRQLEDRQAWVLLALAKHRGSFVPTSLLRQTLSGMYRNSEFSDEELLKILSYFERVQLDNGEVCPFVERDGNNHWRILDV